MMLLSVVIVIYTKTGTTPTKQYVVTPIYVPIK